MSRFSITWPSYSDWIGVVVWVRPCAGCVDSVDAEAVEVGASVVTVEIGLDAAVSVDVAEAVEVGASVVTVEVGLGAAVSVVARELLNNSECFHSIPLSEFIDFMCFSS
ncbi:hypothetical protein NKH36_31495 [Mesorhizobium sp. M1312]|uniref:hypothetical protein n=1 Tax=unclassified Mesorhizobium TaxID=325217 RepID=UPI0033399BCA